MRAALAGLNPNIALTSVMSMEARVSALTARPRVVTLLLGLFSGVSLFLVAAGLYGTIAFAVARRTRELGLRVSLGASRGSLLTMVVRHGVGLTLAGVVAGVVGSSWAMQFLESLVFGTESDALALVSACAVLLTVGSIAAYLPARRATRIDPMVALRTE